MGFQKYMERFHRGTTINEVWIFRGIFVPSFPLVKILFTNPLFLEFKYHGLPKNRRHWWMPLKVVTTKFKLRISNLRMNNNNNIL